MIILQLTAEDLQKMITNAIREAISGHIGSEVKPTDEPLIKGIKGLSEFLNISHSKSQAIKNSGILPYSQNDRLIYFDPAKVREIMTVTKPLEKRRLKK